MNFDPHRHLHLGYYEENAIDLEAIAYKLITKTNGQTIGELKHFLNWPLIQVF